MQDHPHCIEHPYLPPEQDIQLHREGLSRGDPTSILRDVGVDTHLTNYQLQGTVTRSRHTLFLRGTPIRREDWYFSLPGSPYLRVVMHHELREDPVGYYYESHDSPWDIHWWIVYQVLDQRIGFEFPEDLAFWSVRVRKFPIFGKVILRALSKS